METLKKSNPAGGGAPTWTSFPSLVHMQLCQELAQPHTLFMSPTPCSSYRQLPWGTLQLGTAREERFFLSLLASTSTRLLDALSKRPTLKPPSSLPLLQLPHSWAPIATLVPNTHFTHTKPTLVYLLCSNKALNSKQTLNTWQIWMLGKQRSRHRCLVSGKGPLLGLQTESSP